MYSQNAWAASRRRGVRSYSAASVRGRRGTPGQERVRLFQLAVCLALFLAVFLWKGIFPQKLGQVRDDLLALITTDLDFQGALAELGESLARGETVLADLGAFCAEIFGPDQPDKGEEPGAQEVLTPPPLAADALNEELNFLCRETDPISCTAHYFDFSRYGLKLTAQGDSPVLDEPLPAETDTAWEPPAVPAAGTVIMISDYSGEPLPNNYTMDQLSLGELETATPAMGHLNSEYGYRDHPINGRYQFHGGVDIGGQNGDPIKAFGAGTVEYIGEDNSYGLYFQIDHGNGVKSFYAHCSKILVKKGQTVALGEKVAEIGSSGSATGPHLHLELKYNKMHLNPAYYVDFLEL